VKRSIQVEIAGQQLTIRSDEGAEYVHQLADYVDAHLRVLSGGRRITSQQNLQRVALLVAMQLADELFREKDLHQRFRRRVGDKLDVLRRAIDDHEHRLAGLALDPGHDNLSTPPAKDGETPPNTPELPLPLGQSSSPAPVSSG